MPARNAMAATPMPESQPVRPPAAVLEQATRLLKSGQAGEALQLAHALAGQYPQAIEPWLLASHAEQQRVRFEAMLEAARVAARLAPEHPPTTFRLLECLLYCGRYDEVLERLGGLEAAAGADGQLLCRIAELYSQGNRHAEARRCYARASLLRADDPDVLFSLAASEIALGDAAAAEMHLERVIALNPHDYDAYRNRATLRRQTPEHNHIAQIQAALAAGVRRPAGEVQLCYALAKEYEDLGDHRTSFVYLKRGADRRRGLLSYRVEEDLEVMAAIRECFDAALMQRAPPAVDAPGPIFVLGLPRSGTTLVERILSSHSHVASLGEVNDFAYSLMHTLASPGSKTALVARSAGMDFAQLGRRYLAGTRAYGFSAAYLIDKTPLNYLYLGLLRLALPEARIVHVRRNPMDSCYGMYRTLFRAGYPFSYDFDDLARYYLGYRQLMDHWHGVLPGGFHELSYEHLVDDQEAVSRALLDYCGLEWQPACLEFHRNTAPVSTASSVQVRRPVYRDALQRWRRYEAELAPLAERLRAGGIDIEAS